MATPPSIFSNEEEIRCQDVRWSLDVFNIGIKDYFEDIFRLFHTNLKQNVVQIHGYCSQKCSRKLPVEKWCSLCNEWRVKILAKHRFRNTIKDILYWKNVDSSKWQSDVREVQKIFLPNWYKGKLDANDLSSRLNIMTNCTLFDNQQQLTDIRDIRNKVFHNKTSLTVKEKKDYVGTISSYLDNDFLKRYQSVVKATEHVKLLEKC
ncbi:hypothetical protein FSP39_023625 [Pinctada imbricata]|uniref:Uncharacterized protein n=1 Tax=Pinctada imbricata TaxID=66713 RepID=A0AA88XM39_PINIB|nr:hypothetical protein FSP39_023625 [Pinctada imbricata]